MAAFLPAEDLARETEKAGRSKKKSQHFYLQKTLRGRPKKKARQKNWQHLYLQKTLCEDRKNGRAKITCRKKYTHFC